MTSLPPTATPLTEDEAEAVFGAMLDGRLADEDIACFLTELSDRGETAGEIAGAARAMRARLIPIRAPANAIDVCGTGGDGHHTLNVSTAVSLVVAACGVPVAKHGNRAASSKSGSADVLAALGVNLDADMALVAESLRVNNIGFMMAPRHHAAMRFVGPTRVELGTRTIFNLLGPLANPAAAKRQLLGVFSRQWIAPVAEVLGQLGSERAWVVHGSDGLDELTTTGASYVAELKDGKVTTFEVTPEDAGLARVTADALKGGDPAHNAQAIIAMLDGATGPYRDIVLLNAAAALIVAGKAADLKAGVKLAAEAIASGKAKATLAALVATSTKVLA